MSPAQKAKRKLFIIVMAIIWLAALIIAPYYIAKPQLDVINQERLAFVQELSAKTTTQDVLQARQKPYVQEYSRYLASVYAVFSAIWIIFPLVGIWVAVSRRRMLERRRKTNHR